MLKLRNSCQTHVIDNILNRAIIFDENVNYTKQVKYKNGFHRPVATTRKLVANIRFSSYVYYLLNLYDAQVRMQYTPYLFLSIV